MKITKLNEASQIQYTELKPIQQKQISAFEKILRGKHQYIYDGIHGFIVSIKVSGGHGAYRFDTETLKKLISLKIRWVEADATIITIAF